MFHRRCHAVVDILKASIEAQRRENQTVSSLLSRIQDLEEQLRGSHEILLQQAQEAREREQSLITQLLAFANPAGSAAAIRLTTPTAPMPTAGRTRERSRPGAKAPLNPEAAGFNPRARHIPQGAPTPEPAPPPGSAPLPSIAEHLAGIETGPDVTLFPYKA